MKRKTYEKIDFALSMAAAIAFAVFVYVSVEAIMAHIAG